MWGDPIVWKPEVQAVKEFKKQNKGDRSLLNTLQGSSGQDSKGGGVGNIVKGEGKEVWERM